MTSTNGNSKNKSTKVAHSLPGRIRLRLAEPLPENERHALIADLKLSPEIRNVKVSSTSILIEHTQGNEHPWSLLEKWFPTVSRVSDAIDTSVSRLTETPEVNKLVPLGFLGFAIYKTVRDGAFMAGESAFAIAYIAFDLYWKFQQENVTRKIQTGLTKGQQGQIQSQA